MRKLTMQELNRAGVSDFRRMAKTPVWIILDNIRSQQNTGSVFRTSDAFRLEGISLCGITATPPHREIHRTALGAEESVEWNFYESTTEAVRTLKALDYLVIGVEQTDESVYLGNYRPPKDRKLALVFGNEVNGISDEVLPLLDAAIEIPQFGTKHSLNIAVSAGIITWDLYQKIFP